MARGDMGIRLPVRASRAAYASRVFKVRVRRVCGLLCLLLCLSALVASPVMAGLPLALDTQHKLALGTGAALGEAAWADFNNDHYLDLVITGRNSYGANSTLFENNQAGNLPTNASVLQALESSSTDWGDYDNDGYLDLVLTGYVNPTTAFTGIYHNDAVPGGRRLVLKQALTGVFNGAARWGDYDNDGRLDLLVTGSVPGATSASGAPFTRIYHNVDGAFVDAGFLGLVALDASAAAWGNFNNDAYLDFAILGLDASDTPRLVIYCNSSGSFNSDSIVSVQRASAPAKIGLHSGTLNWLDYNANGVPELLVSGNASADGIDPNTVLYVYKSSGATRWFEELPNTGLPGIWNSSISTGDYDNDGYPDVLLNGLTSGSRPTAIYHNNGGSGSFSQVVLDPPLADGSYLSVAFGDFNTTNAPDHSLDAVISGISPDAASPYDTYIYSNVLSGSDAANTPPSAPAIRAACWNGSTSSPRLTFDWGPSTDDHDAASLSYNLRVGTAGAASQEVISPSADLSSGLLRQPRPGNTGYRRAYYFRKPVIGQSYSWSVQAVDSAYAGGLFSSSGQADVGTRVAENDSFSVSEGGSLDIPVVDLLANDNHAYDTLSYYSYEYTPAYAGNTLTLSPDRSSFTFTPVAHWSGTQTFTYYALGKNAYCSPATVTITVSDVNSPPTGISLAPSSLIEGLPGAAKVGTLSTTDPDIGDSFTYALIDNPSGSFELRNGNEIWAVQPLSFAHGDYAIRVQSTDSGVNGVNPQSVMAVLTISPIQNHAPTAVHLSNLVIPLGQAAGYTVGALSTDDADAGESFSYSFSPDSSSFDNARFSLAGDQLKTGQSFTSPGSYTIHVLATDRGGQTVEGVFTIQVVDPHPQVNCGPANCSALTPLAAGQYALVVTMSEDGQNDLGEPDAFALSLQASPALGTGALSWQAMPPTRGGSASLSAGSSAPGEAVQVHYTPAANWNSGPSLPPIYDVFPIYIKDAANNTSIVTVYVQVNPVNDPPQANPVSPAPLYKSGSGQHTLEISGLAPGPADESGQNLSLGIATSLPYGPISAASLSTPVNGKTTLSLTIGAIPEEMAGTFTFPLVIYLDDDQPYHHRSELTIPVNIVQNEIFFPIMQHDGEQ